MSSQTIYELFKRCSRKYSSKVAICCDNKQISYMNLLKLVEETSVWFQAIGIGKGTKVGISIKNSIEFVIFFLALNKCDAVVILVSNHYKFAKLKDVIQAYGIHYLIAESHNNELMHACPELLGIIEMETHNVYMSESCPSLTLPEEELKDTAVILFSSGTTSVPKAIMLSNNNIISNIASINSYMDLSEHNNILMYKNIHHASSLTGELLLSLTQGCTLYITKNLITTSGMLSMITKHHIDTFFTIPPIMVDICEKALNRPTVLKSLRKINMSGSSTDYEVFEKFIEVFTWIEFINSYGLSEASPRVSYIKMEEWNKKRTSNGKPIDHVHVSIMNQRTEILGPNMIGEIVVTGPNVMRGYYRNKSLTAEVLRQGHLFTNDLGYLDDEGYLYVVGRQDNLIIKYGMNIYPEEIETNIIKHHGIKDVMVRFESGSNDLIAYIVSNKAIKKSKLIEHCRNYMEDYKIPGILYLVTKIEKNQSGKIDRTQNIANHIIKEIMD